MSCFCRQFFFSHVECSVLMYLKKKKKAEITMEMLLSGLCFVCELEVLRNDAGSSQLLFPHSVSLLTWGVFSVIPVCFSVIQAMLLSKCLFCKWNAFIESCTQKCSNEYLNANSTACGQRLPLFTIKTKLRLRGRGLLLHRYMCFFFFFFSFLETYFIKVSSWV